MVKSEPKKKPQSGGFFQKFFRKPEKSQKEQRLTVQRSIPYLEMGRDGICRVEEHLYSKTVRFYDINYQLAQNEDKNTIFESWCDFLNYFDTATGFAHQKVHQVEKDNSGVEAAHKSEEAAERLHHFVKGRKKPKDKSARAEKRGGEDQKSSRLKFSESEGGTAENAAEPSLKKKQPQPPPTAAGGESKTVGAKFYQKKQYKDAYAAAKRGQKAGTAASKQAAAAANTITEKAKAAVQEIVAQHKTLWVGIGVGILLVMVMLGALSSCGAAIQGTGSTFVGTTYPSKDADMKGAEEDYLELEKELDKQIRQMESTHPGYDEYRYQLDEIGHDPYQLVSHLTAVYEQFTRGQVKPVIKELFKQQYPRTDRQDAG